MEFFYHDKWQECYHARDERLKYENVHYYLFNRIVCKFLKMK